MMKITMTDKGIRVPDHPVIPFIEGDGVGCDIWPAAVDIFNHAVEKAYGSKRSVDWKEVYAGGKAHERTGEWLPSETFDAIREYLVAIKGPLTTPVGEGFRSINVTLRQGLDLFVCLRPVKYYPGVPSPVRHPERVDMVIFRENTEDLYAGLELPAGDGKTGMVIDYFKKEFGWVIKPDSALGLKPISISGSERLVREAIRYAIENGRRSVTLVHKGNIMKHTEGGFLKWGYELARREFGDRVIAESEISGEVPEGKIIMKNVIVDAFLQQIILTPDQFDVVATMNLNGDYISDALAAQVGGIGIAPGGNINFNTGHAIFEATHGTAPNIAGKGIANPGSLILSGKLMFEYLGWNEAAEVIEKGFSAAVLKGGEERRVTSDMVPFLENARAVSTKDFGRSVIDCM